MRLKGIGAEFIKVGDDGAAKKWRGTDGSNPSPSSGESTNFRYLLKLLLSRRPLRRLSASETGGECLFFETRGRFSLAVRCYSPPEEGGLAHSVPSSADVLARPLLRSLG
jgi:hypothetical protein